MAMATMTSKSVKPDSSKFLQLIEISKLFVAVDFGQAKENLKFEYRAVIKALAANPKQFSNLQNSNDRKLVFVSYFES
jgi:hypothetical protein